MKARRIAGTLVAVALLLCRAAAGEERPITFLRHLRAPDLDDPSYLKEIRNRRPDFLLLGRAVPFDNALGPTSLMAGGDSAARDIKDAALLKPKDLEERVKFLRRLNVVLRESGVKTILPYTSAISLIGEAEKPTGFFEFYRRWHEYPGLGQRPTPSPDAWFAVDTLDNPLPVGDALDPDYLRPMKRYAACPANPGWRAWMQQVVRACVECGYDGAYVDHCDIKPCCCAQCQEKFHSYLSAKYQPEEYKKLHGQGLDAIRLSEDEETFAGVETMLFRQLMLKELLGAMREIGGQQKARLALKGIGLWQMEQFADVGEFFAFDAVGQGQTFNIPGARDTEIINGICDRQSFTNIIPYKCAAALAQKSQLMIDMHTNDAITHELGFAEALAFGAPPIFGGSMTTADSAASAKYRDFLTRHAELFADASPYAQVGIVFFGQHACYPRGIRHVEQALFVMERLAAHRVPFEVIVEGNCNPGALSAYRAVILPALRYASDAQVLTFQNYVEQGGTLVVSEDGFRYNGGYIEREKTWLERAINRPENRKEDILHAPVKKGWIVHTPRFFDDDALAQGIRRGIEAGPLQVIGRGAWHVRVNTRMRRSEHAGDILIHFVNYNVCPRRGAKAVMPERDVFCSVRFPREWSVFSVTAHSPDVPVAKQIEFSQDAENGVLRFNLPEVRVYTVVRVSCRITG
ncbi:MAG: hypothetical protein AB1696_00935 [Planctomycetota bacterium]